MREFADVQIKPFNKEEALSKWMLLEEENHSYQTHRDYVYSEGDIKFNYKYIISAWDVYSSTGDEYDKDNWMLELHMVPEPKTITRKIYKEVFERCDGDGGHYELKFYGYAALMGCRTVHESEIESNILEIMSVIDLNRDNYLYESWSANGHRELDAILYAIGYTDINGKPL